MRVMLQFIKIEFIQLTKLLTIENEINAQKGSRIHKAKIHKEKLLKDINNKNKIK